MAWRGWARHGLTIEEDTRMNDQERDELLRAIAHKLDEQGRALARIEQKLDERGRALARIEQNHGAMLTRIEHQLHRTWLMAEEVQGVIEGLQAGPMANPLDLLASGNTVEDIRALRTRRRLP